MNDSKLLLLGAGYTAGFLAKLAKSQVKVLCGTTRSREKFSTLEAMGIQPIEFDGTSASDELLNALTTATHVVVSIAPGRNAAAVDPLLSCVCLDKLQVMLEPGARSLPLWIAYLSTVGVYGNASGEWVDEESPCEPGSTRSRHRLMAERQWQALAERCDAVLAVFRLPGIYGPGRNALMNLQAGKSRRIVKPGQVFNRAHVEDIAAAVWQAMQQRAEGIYNICDDSPSPPQDVIGFAAELMGVDPPPLVDFDNADLTPMARSFYGENKRVSNARSREELGVRYLYPDYKAGFDGTVGVRHVEPALNDLFLFGLAVYLLSGTVKGVVGIGLPTAAIGLMSQVTDPLSAIALAIVPMVITNMWQMVRSGHIWRTIKRYSPFGFMLCIFIYFSSGFAKNIPPHVLQMCVGFMVTLFAVDALWRKPFKLNPRYDIPAQLCAGVVAGSMGGIAGIWSPPMVGYLLARQVGKDEFVRALGFMIFSGSVFLCIGYIQAGILTPALGKLSAIMVIPALVGFTLGELIRRRLGAERFRKVVLIFFIAMGLNLIRKGLW